MKIRTIIIKKIQDVSMNSKQRLMPDWVNQPLLCSLWFSQAHRTLITRSLLYRPLSLRLKQQKFTLMKIHFGRGKPCFRNRTTGSGLAMFAVSLLQTGELCASMWKNTWRAWSFPATTVERLWGHPCLLENQCCTVKAF